MSEIVILTFGTYGDVAPYLGLGAALRAAGHDVALASQAPYRELIETAGLEYRFLQMLAVKRGASCGRSARRLPYRRKVPPRVAGPWLAR